MEPNRRDGSKVTLKNGIELGFEEGHDVSERNAGVVILAAGGEDSRHYLRWEDTRHVEFE